MKIISLCTVKVHSRECHSFITNLSAALFEHNCKLFVYSTCSDLFTGTDTDLGEAKIYDLIDYSVTDAVIIYYEFIKDKKAVLEIISKAKAHGKPVIIIEGNVDGCINICFDYDKGFEQTVKHIIEFHKVSDVHFVAGFKGNSFSDNRIRIFKKVLAENDIPFDDSMISYGDFWSEPTEAAIEKLIAEKRVPRAVICANDSMAVSACNTLVKHGFKVPQDVIISGFDGIEDVKFSVPQITTCERLLSDIANKACELTVSALNGSEDTGIHYVVPQMLVAESCGCEKHIEYNMTETLAVTNKQLDRFRSDEYTLFQTASQIQMSSTFEEAASYLTNRLLYDTYCMLNISCLNNTINPAETLDCEPFQEDMILFFNADNAEEQVIREFKKKEIIPKVKDKIHDPYPLIFSAISFHSSIMGYACFHYHNFDIVNYNKIQQNITTLNNSLIGLRNTRYQKHLALQIEEMYRTDNLTGLYNRTAFSRLYEKLIKENREIALVLVDLDKLKLINDFYGHDEGDNAISAVADAIRSIFPDCICGRFGGDEMVIASKDKLDEEDIKRRFSLYFDNFNRTSGKPYSVNASVGVYNTNHENSMDFVELLKKADKLMYADKMLKNIKSTIANPYKS